MNPRKFLKLQMLAVLAACFLAPPALAQPTTAVAVIDSVMAAYGGRPSLLAVRAYRLDGVLRAHVLKRNAEVVRIVRTPLDMDLMIRYPSKMEIRRKEAGEVWRGGSPHTLSPVRGPLRGSVVLQAARVNYPWILDEMKDRARLSRSADGFDALEMPVEEGLRLIAFVDRTTRRIVRSESVVKAGKRKIRFLTRYSDFRKVEGVLFPFREETYISKMHTGTTVVVRIRVNPPDEGMKFPIPPGHPGGERRLKFSSLP